VASKANPLKPGSAAPQLIRRGELLASLDRAAEAKVTLISAPAGSGKTSLLRAWADGPGQPYRLAVVQVRRNRLSSLGEARNTSYVDLESVRAEVTATRHLFEQQGWPAIDVSRRSVEETAAAVMNLLTDNKVKIPEPLRSHYPQLESIADAPAKEPTLFPLPPK